MKPGIPIALPSGLDSSGRIRLFLFPIALPLVVLYVMWLAATKGYRWLTGQDPLGDWQGTLPQNQPNASNRLLNDQLTHYHTDPNCKELAERLFVHLNEYRQSHGLSPVRWNEQLEQSALYHGHRMIQLGEFEHTLSDGVELTQRFQRVGYDFSSGAENLYMIHNPKYLIHQYAEAMHVGWVNSPGHEKNLRFDGSEVGIGVVTDGETYWATQNFGEPRIPAPDQPAANPAPQPRFEWADQPQAKPVPRSSYAIPPQPTPNRSTPAWSRGRATERAQRWTRKSPPPGDLRR